MAQLKDTLITGDLRVTDNITADTAQITILKAKTTSSTSETNFGPGTVGEILKSNGTNTYWASNDAVTTATVSGQNVTFTKGNGSTFKITTQDTNTTYANFTPATTSAAGAAGLIPAPTSAQYSYVLSAHGWTNVIDCGYEG